MFSPRITDVSAWVYTTTLGGGLVGGDDIRLAIDVDAGARVLAVTQASTKVYRSARESRQQLDATVGADAIFVSLPDPLVPFAGSRLEQRQRFALHLRGSVLAMDWFTSGRVAFGERWAFDRYASRFEMIRDGRPIFSDHLLLDRADQSIAERMQRFNICMVLVAAGPAFAPLAGEILARVAAVPAPAMPRGSAGAPRSEPGEGRALIDTTGDALVVSAFPLGDDGLILRLAAVSLEGAAGLLRDWLRPVVPLLGDDPWGRRQ